MPYVLSTSKMSSIYQHMASKFELTNFVRLDLDKLSFLQTRYLLNAWGTGYVKRQKSRSLRSQGLMNGWA